MGLKRGVVASRNELPEADAGLTQSSSVESKGGNISMVEVTRSDRSRALKYFPTDL
jgi:hypothetical protein